MNELSIKVVPKENEERRRIRAEAGHAGADAQGRMPGTTGALEKIEGGAETARALEKRSKVGKAVSELSQKPELAGAMFDGAQAQGAALAGRSGSADFGKIEDALAFIQKYDSFVVVAHESPDGDAIGSTLGMVGLLRAMGKTAYAYNSSRTPRTFRFVPGSESVINDPAKIPPVQAVITVDVSEAGRTGSKLAPFIQGKPLLNVDHHKSNSAFGSSRWVDGEATAAAEMVADIWSRLRLTPTRDAAMALYTGIFTDSGLMRYHVTAATLRTAAALVDAGADPGLISRKIEQSKQAGYFELLKTFVDTLQTNPEKTRGDATFSLDASGRDGGGPVTLFADNILQVESIKVSIIFLQVDKDTWVASLRSKEDVDVDLIARQFGGGGHKNAAACKVKIPLAEFQAKVRQAVDAAVR